MSDPGADRRLPSLDQVRRRLDDVRERIAAVGGDPAAVRICAVTKGLGVEAAHLALAAGLRDLGENYAQELERKAGLVTEHGVDPEAVRWHMIGTIQRNKVRRLSPHVWCWQTVDRPEVVDELASRASGTRVMIQVNATGEAHKGGVEPARVAELAARIRAAGLELCGLMSVGPTDPSVDPAPGFRATAELARALDLTEVSMGMSRDLEAAVAAGSTMVRLGTALFGPRPTGATVG